jgi:hypothetical protein
MDISVTNIQILPKSEFSPEIPARYCASVEFSETDTPYCHDAKINVLFDADENAQMKEIQELAIAKAKEYLQKSLSKF